MVVDASVIAILIQAGVGIATVAVIKTDVAWVKTGLEKLDARVTILESQRDSNTR